MKNIMLSILLLLFLSACASSSKVYKANFSYKALEADNLTGDCKFDSSLDLKDAINAASYCYAKNDFMQLHQLAEHIRALDEKAPWGYYFDSLYFADKNYLEPALWYALKAEERDGKNAIIKQHLGRLNYMLNKNSIAVDYFEKAVAIDSSLDSSRSFLASIYLNEKMYDKAYQTFINIKDIKDKTAYNTGLYISAMHLKKYEEAINYLRKISKRDYSNQNFVDLAYMYTKVEKIDDALDTYKYVLNQNKWQNTSYTKQIISDKIRELEMQQRSIANAKEKEGA